MTNDLIEIPQAGRVGPHRESHESRLMAHDFLADGVTPVTGFLEWNGAAGVGEHWGMDANDLWGDCGAAATDHNNIAKTGNPQTVGTLGRPQFDGTLGTYWAYGLSMGWVGVPPHLPMQPDQGIDNATWLGFLYKMGIIYGYGEVEDDEFDWFAQLFDGGIVGQGLNGGIASNDFNARPRIPWDTMDQPDGHDTLTIITHADGSGACVTWGAVQPYTAAYRRTNWFDRWVIFDADDPNVDHAKLQAALIAVHGVAPSVLPPATPTPLPAPATAGPTVVQVTVSSPLSSPVPVPLSTATLLQPNVKKAIIRSIMPFVVSALVAVCIHFGYHPTAQTITWILGAGGGGLTILLHLLETKWPAIGVLLGYLGAPVYAPPKKVLQSNKIDQLQAEVNSLQAAIKALQGGA
jgi:hypothetical protein